MTPLEPLTGPTCVLCRPSRSTRSRKLGFMVRTASLASRLCLSGRLIPDAWATFPGSSYQTALHPVSNNGAR